MTVNVQAAFENDPPALDFVWPGFLAGYGRSAGGSRWRGQELLGAGGGNGRCRRGCSRQ